MRYQNIIIDSVNLAYQVFKTKKEVPSAVGQHNVYKYSVRMFLNEVRELRNKWLTPDGQVYLLFDNYTSRAEMAQMFGFMNRKEVSDTYKANRTKQPQEFYNSLNLIRYYYLHADSSHHTCRIDCLEADDLCKPIINAKCKGQTVLLVSTDLDWARMIGGDVDWLNDIHGEPMHQHDLSDELGFEVNEHTLIAYKALFGDESDNVRQITRKTKEHLEEFRKIAETLVDENDIITLARQREMSDTKTLFYDLRNVSQESHYRSNCQLVGFIPVTEGHIKEVITTGRDVQSMCKAIEDALTTNNERPFSFGGTKGGKTKRPRGESKEDTIREDY